MAWASRFRAFSLAPTALSFCAFAPSDTLQTSVGRFRGGDLTSAQGMVGQVSGDWCWCSTASTRPAAPGAASWIGSNAGFGSSADDEPGYRDVL